MRYQLEQFLEKSTSVCAAQQFELFQFKNFENVVDYLLEQLSAKGHEDIPVDLAPYFGRLWPSAQLLADALSKHGVSGARILELGCGLAYPSLWAALAGADVTVVDANADAQELFERNIALNQIAQRPRFVLSDWRSLALDERFDFVIASDVLYEGYHVESLARVIKKHLTPQGKFLVSDPCRWHYDTFRRAIESLGATVHAEFSTSMQAEGILRQVLISGKFDFSHK